MLQKPTVQPLGPHQRRRWFASDQRLKTSSRGASNIREMAKRRCSGPNRGGGEVDMGIVSSDWVMWASGRLAEEWGADSWSYLRYGKGWI
jgi:hypothetical protein